MRVSWRPAVALAVCALVVALAPAASAAPGAAAAECNGAPAPWLDPGRSADDRAELLVAQLTLDEKISMMGSLRTADAFRETPPLPRLCVPALRLNNGSAGVSTGGPSQFPATALPAPIGLAATWNPDLAYRYGVVGGRETRQQGRNLLEGPDIDIARNPVNGRTFEAYGEDPYLASQIVVGDVRGIQSQGVIANTKHYAANSQETNRATINELIDERTLREIYLAPYEAAVKQANTMSVMCAKNQINGAFSCQNRHTLLDVLKGEWGFKGFVVSDFDSCHETVACANNGMEFELPQSKFFGGPALHAAVDAGTVTVATIDEHVRRIFFSMISLGVLDRPQQVTPIDAALGGSESRQISEQAAVLLKNDVGTLPLNASQVHSVALIGPYAGAAYSGGGGSSHVLPLYTVSPVDGVRKRLAPDAVVRYAPGIQTGTGAPPAVPASAFGPAGLLGEYFPNPTLTGTPQVTRVDPNVDFAFGTGEPAPELPVDMFSVRWTGTLNAPTTGDYTLATTSDDGSRLFVDDALVVDNWGNHSARTVTAVKHLDAGPHSVRIEYYDNTGGASVSFGWIPPGAASSPLEQAVAAAKASDVAVVMVGDEESEGRDRPNLSLTTGQDALVDAVVAANPRTIVVLKSGAPVLMPWLDKVPAVLEAWYPGEEDGNVVASLLFGEVNPSGKLPITFPRADADVPANTPARYPGVNGVATYSEGVFMGYRHYDAHDVAPLFPFGYGLSYTTFGLRDLRVLRPAGATDPRMVATVAVTNTGTRAGSQVVQLYVGRPPDASTPEPVRTLAAFGKVTLAPGETKRVTLTLDARSFAHWDTASSAFVVPDGTYRLFVGTSSRDLPLSTELRVTG